MHMRHQMRYRRKRKPKHITKATNIPGRISIHQRPEPLDGNIEGMWEMDTIIGKDGKGAILTLKERGYTVATYDKAKEGKECLGGDQRSGTTTTAFQGENAQKHHN